MADAQQLPIYMQLGIGNKQVYLLLDKGTVEYQSNLEDATTVRFSNRNSVIDFYQSNGEKASDLVKRIRDLEPNCLKNTDISQGYWLVKGMELGDLTYNHKDVLRPILQVLGDLKILKNYVVLNADKIKSSEFWRADATLMQARQN